jgi:putative hydrolase of the HAD superfamily
VAKPALAFYAKSIELIGCDYSDCVFIDDTLRNVKAAQSVGIQSWHHSSKDGTLAFIKDNCS